ncbi:MAG: helix-turn-helix domain-containing protein [Sulfurimonas sp.]
MDHRFNIDEQIVSTMESHGVAGLFIDPENSLCTLSPNQDRTSPRHSTAFHHSHLSEEAFETIARSLAEGVGICATARIQNVDKKTVLLVLSKAGEHAMKVNSSLLTNLEVTECQLDEMWSFIGKKEKNLGPVEKLHKILGDAWIWIAFDATNKITLAYNIGKRTLPYAISLIEDVKRVTKHIPHLFSSDQLDQYAKALLHVYGTTVYPTRKAGPGRPPNPRIVPSKGLNYVQVVKQYKKYRVAKVSRKIIFGDPKEIEKILVDSSISEKINTAYVERYNGTIRHMDSRCVRKTFNFSKNKINHERQLALTLAYCHLCRPHKALTKLHGQPTTPFMAANLTDHVWTMGELLNFKTAEKACS